jgi:hypothetical protein
VSKRLSIFIEFVRMFLRYAMYVREALVSLVMLIAIGGVVISRLEDFRLGEAIYFAFITGLSIGYGDFAPETAWGRVVSVAIGLIGMVFVGLTVAIATHALADTVTHNLKDNR